MNVLNILMPQVEIEANPVNYSKFYYIHFLSFLKCYSTLGKEKYLIEKLSWSDRLDGFQRGAGTKSSYVKIFIRFLIKYYYIHFEIIVLLRPLWCSEIEYNYKWDSYKPITVLGKK